AIADTLRSIRLSPPAGPGRIRQSIRSAIARRKRPNTAIPAISALDAAVPYANQTSHAAANQCIVTRSQSPGCRSYTNEKSVPYCVRDIILVNGCGCGMGGRCTEATRSFSPVDALAVEWGGDGVDAIRRKRRAAHGAQSPALTAESCASASAP